MPEPRPPAGRPLHFDAPVEATPITTPGGIGFLVGVCVVGIACAVAIDSPPFWPTPSAPFTAIALAGLVAVANLFGTFQTVGGLSEFASLAMPIGFAMLLLLDWRLFVFAVACGEVLTFASESLRRVNPTTWYIRVYNACQITCAGAAAVAVLNLLRPISFLRHAGERDSWLAGGLAITLLLAAVTFKIVDNVTTATLIALALRQPVASVRVPIRTFLSQLALFLIAIPFAALWQQNVWVAIFAIAPLGVAYRLLGLPELEHRARFDARTGLVNAGSFDTLLEGALDDARANRRSVALLAIDIDHFKTINDTHGHLIGDAVIARFAGILSDLARRDDTAARLGGEEFAILLRDVDRPGALALAERVRVRVETEAFDVDAALDTPIRMTASIGVAVSPEDGTSPRDLHGAADAALYRAKQAGRNLVSDAAANGNEGATFSP